jgi:hypothetical protein
VLNTPAILGVAGVLLAPIPCRPRAGQRSAGQGLYAPPVRPYAAPHDSLPPRISRMSLRLLPFRPRRVLRLGPLS